MGSRKLRRDKTARRRRDGVFVTSGPQRRLTSNEVSTCLCNGRPRHQEAGLVWRGAPICVVSANWASQRQPRRLYFVRNHNQSVCQTFGPTQGPNQLISAIHLVCQNFGLIPSASKPKNGRLLEIESLGLSIEKSLSTRLSSWHRPHFSRLQMVMFL